MYGDDGSISRRRSDIYLDEEIEDEDDNGDNVDLHEEDSDEDEGAGIDWGMLDSDNGEGPYYFD